MKNKTETRVGLGFAEALTLLFIALKLCDVIDWPWLWVLSPIWITLVIIVVLSLLVMVLEHISRRR